LEGKYKSAIAQKNQTGYYHTRYISKKNKSKRANMTWTQTLLVALLGFVGGLFGSLLSVRATNKNIKLQLELEIYRRFEELVEPIEDSYTVLRNYIDENGLVFPDEKLPPIELNVEADVPIKRKLYYDTVIEVGNFFDKVSYLYFRSSIGKDVAEESTIREAITGFSELCKKKKFKVSSFKNSQVGTDWNNTWKHIEKFVARKRSKWRVFNTFLFG
jgi:hypothetical protein